MCKKEKDATGKWWESKSKEVMLACVIDCKHNRDGNCRSAKPAIALNDHGPNGREAFVCWSRKRRS